MLHPGGVRVTPGGRACYTPRTCVLCPARNRAQPARVSTTRPVASTPPLTASARSHADLRFSLDTSNLPTPKYYHAMYICCILHRALTFNQSKHLAASDELHLGLRQRAPARVQTQSVRLHRRVPRRRLAAAAGQLTGHVTVQADRLRHVTARPRRRRRRRVRPVDVGRRERARLRTAGRRRRVGRHGGRAANHFGRLDMRRGVGTDGGRGRGPRRGLARGSGGRHSAVGLRLRRVLRAQTTLGGAVCRTSHLANKGGTNDTWRTTAEPRVDCHLADNGGTTWYNYCIWTIDII